MSVSIRAGKMDSENTHLLDCFEHFFNHLRIKPIKRFSLTQVSKKYDLENKKEELSRLKEIAKIAEKEIQKERARGKTEENAAEYIGQQKAKTF